MQHAARLFRTYAESLGLRLCLAIAALAAGWAVFLLLPDNRLIQVASYASFAFLAVSLVVLPPVLGLLGLALLALVFGAFAYVSRVKAALTELPLTSMDLKIALLNPDGLIGAMQWSRAGAYVAVAASSAGLAILAFRLIRSQIRQNSRNFAALSLSFLLMGSASFATVNKVSDRLYQAVKADKPLSDDLWQPSGLVALARRTGAAAFVWMTSRIEGAAGNSVFFSIPEKVAGSETLRRDVLFYADVHERQGDADPNVVVMLLESTIDVGAVFDVVPEVPTRLGEDDQRSLLGGRLTVNAIGGGTWITEFEVMTGINSRLFGYAGYYSHVSLSPYVTRVFPEQMRSRGYETVGFYSVPGKFYGTGAAYGRYGIGRVVDTDELGIKDPWSMKDDALIDAYLGKFPEADARPVLAYMATMENHAPHHCVAGNWAKMPHTFVKSATVQMNCQLNEYVARLHSTERAVAKVEKRLQEIETRTGRPYLLVIYGDHQPHTFVGTGGNDWSPYDYGALRKIEKNRTFYQIRGSVRSPFNSTKLAIPAFALPTLISAFLARTSDDLYLPENLSVVRACGPQVSIGEVGGLGELREASAVALQGACEDAVAAQVHAVRENLWKR